MIRNTVLIMKVWAVRHTKEIDVDNSDTESMLIDRKEENGSNRDEDESMGSTDEKILYIEEKARESKEEI